MKLTDGFSEWGNIIGSLIRPGAAASRVDAPGLFLQIAQCLCLLLAFAGAAQGADPVVEETSISEGRPGNPVQFRGKNLADVISVSFNGASAQFRQLGSRLVTAVVPDGATDGSIVITTSQGSADAGFFDVHLRPVVFSMSASNIVVGEHVTVTGENFLDVSDVKLVSPADMEGISITFDVISDSQLNFAVAGGGSNLGFIRLESPFGNVIAGEISVEPATYLPSEPEPAVCGDGFCAVGEDFSSCPDDCDTTASCGGISDPSEVRVSTDVEYSFTYNSQTYSRAARLFAPKTGTQSGACPMVVVLPGGCGDKDSAEWTGPMIAARGYVVLVAEVLASDITNGAGPENAQVCDVAARGAMDFLQSPSNPFLADSDTTRIGGAGYSLGARTWVKTQEVDDRVGAIVAWDNLAISEDGDIGSPACTNEPGVVRRPRVPAMGQASELTCLLEPARADRGADSKKNGFMHWREAGVPSMQLTIRNAGHFAWGGRDSEMRSLFAYYTTNWFDRFLKGDMNATQRLVSRNIPVGDSRRNVADLFSDTWRSAAYLDGYDCPDFLAACSAGDMVEWKSALSGGGPGVDYSRGAACDTTGRCVASGDLRNAEGVFGEYQVLFGEQRVTLDSSSMAPPSSYVWGFSAQGNPEVPAIVPGFASVDVDMQSDGTAVVAGRQFTELQTLMGPLTSQTRTNDAAWVGMDRGGQLLYGAVFGSGAVDTINEVVVADDDTVVVTGPFGQNGGSGDLQFPDGSLAPFTGGDQDVFVAKFSPTGTFLWGMGLLGDAHEEGRGVSVLPSGDVMLCGEFDGQLQLGSSHYRAVEGSPDVFVTLLDGSTGGVIWSRQFGAEERDVCRGVDPGQDGDIIISGEYESYLNLDGISLRAHGSGDRDIFIARLRASDGAVVAAQTIGSSGEDVGCELESGENDAIWCAGSAATSLDYPGGRMGTSGDQFLLRFSPDLTEVEQALSFGGKDASSLNFAIGLAPGNRGMVVGSMAGTVIVKEQAIIAPQAGDDFFVARFGPSTEGQ